ncbi:MAG TPA: sugar phosphate isomerase/epimerase [Planctomycetota bacterium]|nr:sugar phosphate isomerase/epimerase [Planctomycetota bacterium]
MKLGVMTALFGQDSLDDMLKKCKDVGLDAVEICAGNYPGMPHMQAANLLKSDKAAREFKEKIASYGLEISGLSCHGNPLHPDKKVAKEHHTNHRNAVKLAKKLGVGVVINFSGCPGDSDGAKHPNWVTCPWPDDFTEVVQWQWEKKVVPYWKEEAKFAADNGIKLAFEMHPGFCVYNTETMLRLRSECGKNIGANFDPSHLFWQGMDPLVSLRALKGAVWHVHAKDCRIDPSNTLKNGVLDTKSYGDEINRSWVFRTIGFGHGEGFWRDFVSELRLIGYDGVVSIEHEDSLLSVNEGLTKAVALLKDIILREKRGAMWWA